MSKEYNGILQFDNKTGLKVFNKAEIRDELINITNESFGADFSLQEGSEFYSFIDLLAGSLADIGGACQEVYNSLGFISASGITLDNCVSLVGITRKPKQASYVEISSGNSTGSYGVIGLNAGAIIQDSNGNMWKSEYPLEYNLPTSIEGQYIGKQKFYAIGDNSASQYVGANNNGEGSWIIKSGATSNISNTNLINEKSSIYGNDEETDAQLRVRTAQALFNQASSTVQALKAHILQNTSLDYAYIVENSERQPAVDDTYDKYSYKMPLHSIWSIVSGIKSSWKGYGFVYKGSEVHGVINFANSITRNVAYENQSTNYTPSYDSVSGTLGPYHISVLGVDYFYYPILDNYNRYTKNCNVYLATDLSMSNVVGTLDLDKGKLELNSENYEFTYSSDDASDIETAKNILMYKSLGCITSGGTDDDFENNGYDASEGTGLISVLTALDDQPETLYRVYFSRARKKYCKVSISLTMSSDAIDDISIRDNITTRIKTNIAQYINKLGISNDVLYSGVMSCVYKVVTDSAYSDFVFDVSSLTLGDKDSETLGTSRIEVGVYQFPYIDEEDIEVILP